MSLALAAVLAGRTQASVAEQVRNLLANSEEFTTWDTFSVTLTGSQSDPDGGTDAYAVDQAGSNAFPRVYTTVTGPFQSEDVVLSLHVKEADSPDMALQVLGSSDNARRNFTWSGGVLSTGPSNSGTNVALTDSGVVDEGGGWYRPWMHVTIGGTSEPNLEVRLAPIWNSVSLLGNIFYGAQFEQATNPTTYQPTP